MTALAAAAHVPLSLTLLGVPEVRWAGEGLPLARRQTRALLYRLAAQRGPTARAHLCLLFWPDLPDAAARRNLTHLLTLLRRSLPEPTVVRATDDSVSLDGERTWCDAVVFTELTATADPQSRPEALQKAVTLYRGVFLDGFALPDSPEFDAWLEQERDVWERRYRDALAAVVEGSTAAGDYGAAITAAQRYLALDDLAEEMHRRLIALYAASGDRAAALRQFERCAAALEGELGVAPLPETRAVYEVIRAGGMPLPARQTGVGTVGVAIPPAARTDRQAPRGALPVPSGPLIGRATELAEVTALLQDRTVRLLTLSGPGGAGKTRLALEVARAVAPCYHDGAAFVPLEPLREVAQVVPAIAQAIGLSDQSDQPPLTRVQEALREREFLLVLDNVEHVAGAAVQVAALLTAAPRLTILVTSRVLLRLSGEHVYPVPPLALPDPVRLPPLAQLTEVGAVALFLARVRARLPTFALTEANAAEIAAICARLDGLPLAIELAAARAVLLSPRALLARLDRSLTLLTAGPRDLPARQQTLRATIDWSYALLDPGEQLLLGRLAVFAGGWSLEGAEAVCSAVGTVALGILDGLDALVSKHLVQRAGGGHEEARFALLETIREYALERLTERGELPAAQHAHALYYLALAEMAAPALHGPEQVSWFGRLDDDQANLRVALAWLLASGHAPGAQRLAAALSWYWHVRGHLTEGRAWLERAVGQARQAPPLERAQAHYGSGLLALDQGHLAAARAHLAESEALARRLAAGPDGGSPEARRLLIRALGRLGTVRGMLGEEGSAAVLSEVRALTRTLHDERITGEVAFMHGRGLLHQRRHGAAPQAYLLEAQAIFRRLGDVWSLAQVLIDLGMLALETGDTTAARERYAEALAAARRLKDRALEALAHNNLGEAARLAGDDAAAGTHYAASLRIYGLLGSRSEIPRLVHNLGYLALHRGDQAHARNRFMESLALFQAGGQGRGVAEAVAGLAAVAAQDRTPSTALRAARLWGAADALQRGAGGWYWPADRAEQARYQAVARTACGAAPFVRAFTQGAAMGLDEVLPLALE